MFFVSQGSACAKFSSLISCVLEPESGTHLASLVIIVLGELYPTSIHQPETQISKRSTVEKQYTEVVYLMWPGKYFNVDIQTFWEI